MSCLISVSCDLNKSLFSVTSKGLFSSSFEFFWDVDARELLLVLLEIVFIVELFAELVERPFKLESIVVEDGDDPVVAAAVNNERIWAFSILELNWTESEFFMDIFWSVRSDIFDEANAFE